MLGSANGGQLNAHITLSSRRPFAMKSGKFYFTTYTCDISCLSRDMIAKRGKEPVALKSIYANVLSFT